MKRAINRRLPQTRRYAAFYKRQEVLLYAASPWKAHRLAIAHFKATTDYYVSVMPEPTKAELREDRAAAKRRQAILKGLQGKATN